MTSIFISYRRGDSIATAGRIRDRLVQEFGRGCVFVDVDDIAAGEDFVRILNDNLAKSKVLLAIIGPGWIGATGDGGLRRLDDPSDLVGIELATALAKSGTSVIPVLIDGAQMPMAGELPEPLKPLARRNAIELRNSQFASDADRLIKAIKAAMPKRGLQRSIRMAGALTGLTVVGIAAVFMAQSYQRLPATSNPRPPAAVATLTGAGKPSSPKRASTALDIEGAVAKLRQTLASAEGQVVVAINDGAHIKLGKQIVFNVTSQVPGRLILVDLNAAGEATQIFPNRFLTGESAGLVRAGATTTIPGAGYGFSGFQAVEPTGSGRLIAIVVPASTPAGRFLQVANQQTKGFEPVNDPAAYLSQLVDEVVTLAKAEPEAQRPDAQRRGLAFALVDYEIVK